MAKPRSSETEEAHDVLAAEAFQVPAADPELHHHGPVVLPEDPSGNPEPHDILAAEEFALPARSGEAHHDVLSRAADAPLWSMLGAAGAVVALIGLRLRRR